MMSKKAASPEDTVKLGDERARADIARSTSSMQAEINFVSRIMEKPVIGTSLSKFVGFYSPAYDAAPQKVSLEDGVKDPELTSALEDDRKSVHYRHRKKRDWMKSYMDECVKYAAVTKGKK
eukprot:PhF_6_TR43625/c0_g1_i1/m.67018